MRCPSVGPGAMGRKVDGSSISSQEGKPHTNIYCFFVCFFVIPTVHPSGESGLCPWPLPLPLPTWLLRGKPRLGYVIVESFLLPPLLTPSQSHQRRAGRGLW